MFYLSYGGCFETKYFLIRFLPNSTTMITYDHNLVLYWFIDNKGYHSNDSGRK